jgi:hypothetical protein
MRRLARHIATVFLPVGAALSCRGADARDSVANASAQVAIAAATISGQEARLANEVAHPSYMGFDTGMYPGDEAMRAWRSGDSPYSWTGYYLPSPCHQDEGWSGKRETLTAMGYGLAVLYVGQQTWGRKPGAPHMERVRVPKKVASYVGKRGHRRKVTRTVMKTVLRKAPPPAADATCNADFVSGPRGMHDGVDAALRTAREGFPRGTTVFLDLERMDVLHQSMRDYYSAWVRAVLDDGRYVPGIYVHTDNANTVYNDVKAVYRSVGLESEPPFWVAKSRGFDTKKHPTEMGHAFAAIWQGVLDTKQTWNGHRIPIDVNVAALPSPSSVVAEIAAGFRAGE